MKQSLSMWEMELQNERPETGKEGLEAGRCVGKAESQLV